MARIAVLGLGLMGAAIAENLLNRKHEVHVYNRTISRARPLEARGAIIHSTPVEAVKSGVDIVITMVTDQNVIREIALGKDGFLEGIAKGSAWIDMSTILPEASIEHAAECNKRGIERLDAPVLGGPQLAATGDLVIIVGGTEGTYMKHLDFLRQMGKEVIYIGPEGAGHKLKLAYNLYLAILASGFSEALVFAEKLGIKGKDFVNVVNKTHHKTGYTEAKGMKVVNNDFTPTFTLGMMRKDLALVQDEAIAYNMSLPVASSVLNLYTSAMNQGLTESDYSSIAVAIRKINGISNQQATAHNMHGRQ
ncbi:MAG: NAD(P)-dependent oxidoreductase [Candidatus Bathyarchaeia archaeon]|jgi:3-hydroxyisobutyrate dehydrogenase